MFFHGFDIAAIDYLIDVNVLLLRFGQESGKSPFTVLSGIGKRLWYGRATIEKGVKRD